MPNHLSVIGIIHTIISVIAVLTAFYALAQNGKIDPKSSTGELYIGLTILACISSLPVMKTGHFTGAHGLAILVLTILPIGIYARKIRLFGNKGEYVQVALMSVTLFFSMIPAIVETLTRIPLSQPVASSDQSPIIKISLLILVALYIAGVIYQIRKIRLERQTEQIYGDLQFLRKQ